MVIGHAKVILLGEHSVVHGRPALAAGLGVGCTATAARGAEDRLRLHPWNVTVSPGACAPPADAQVELTRRAFAALIDSVASTDRYHIDARLDFPAGVGLGGSAAVGVAIVRALDEAQGRRRPPAEVASAVTPWERAFHGNPSGVDAAMAASGGIALYHRGKPFETLAVRHKPLLVIAHSGQVTSTKTMIDEVARRHRADPRRMDAVFDEIAGLVREARDAVQSGDLPRFGELMDRNHELLQPLGVSTERLNLLCQTAREAGALGAKLTGGGGGGCMIALVHDRASAERVREALQPLSQQVLVTEAGA